MKHVMIAFLLSIVGANSVIAETTQLTNKRQHQKPTKIQTANLVLKAALANIKAERLGCAWQHTSSQLIGPAKEQFRQGHYDKATALANQAMTRINRELEQHERTQTARLHRQLR